MSSNFPANLDNSTSLPYPAALSKRNSPSLSGLSDNQNDAIIATQTKLGTGASTPTGTNLLISTGTGSSAWAKASPTGAIVGTTDSQTLTNKVLTSPTINSPVITNANITTDTVTGFTVPTTGTVYGVPISLGVIATANTVNGSSLVASTVGTSALANASVTPNKLATGALAALVATSEQTASTSYTDLATTTDTVTITVGANGLALVSIYANLYPNGAATALVSFTLSGANTVAATDTMSIANGINGQLLNFGASFLLTGLTAGSTTFKMKYKSTNGAVNGVFSNRRISVVPL